jgi:hypothetical protein
MLHLLVRHSEAHSLWLFRFFIGVVLFSGVIASPVCAQTVEWASQVLGYS